MIDFDRALLEITRVIKGKEDSNFKDIVDHARDVQRIVSGKDHDDWVKNVRPWETPEEKKERLRLYRSVTKSAVFPIQTFYRKIYRVDGIRFAIDHKREDEVKETLENYYGGSSLFEYVREFQPLKEFSDPNAISIVARESERDNIGNIKKMSFYPIEIPSSEIPRRSKKNGLLQWIIRRQMLSTDEGKKYRVFTLYGIGIVVTVTEVIDIADQEIDLGTGQRTIIEDKEYFVSQVANTGAKEFPGFEWGTYMDETGTMYVSPIDPASDLLKDSIGLKSKIDVATDKHVFPHRYEYGQRCNHTTANGLSCRGRGYLNASLMPGDEEITCPSCKGEGSRHPKSEQRVTRVELKPFDDKSSILPLSELYHYEIIPLETIVHMDEKLIKVLEAVPYAIFSSQAETVPLASRTATENLLEADQINNRVYPVAEKASRIIEKVARVAAQYMGIDDLKPNHSFPENLKLESLTELINRLSSARAAGAPQDSIFAIQCEIVEKTNAGSPEYVSTMKAFEKHRPWRSLDKAEIARELSERKNTDIERVTYINFDRIQTEIGEEQKNFAKAPYNKQREMIVAKAEEILSEQELADDEKLPNPPRIGDQEENEDELE